MTRQRLSKHFTIEEFDCNDGTKVPNEFIPALKNLCQQYLEPMRKRFGPCYVNSGYRTDAWNRRVGGARFSFHRYELHNMAVAADVRFKRGTIKKWHRRARLQRLWKRKGKGGIGYYPRGGFIHVDTRNYQADWEGP